MVIFQVVQIHFRHQISGFHLISDLHFGNKSFSLKIHGLQTEMHDHLHAVLSLKPISVQRICDRCDSSVHRTVDFSLFRNNGHTIAKNLLGKNLIRDLLQGNYFSLNRSQNRCFFHLLSSIVLVLSFLLHYFCIIFALYLH